MHRTSKLATAGLAACASLLALGPGVSSAASHPAAAALPAAAAALVAVRGTNGALYVHHEGTSGYVNLGGVISTAPSLAPTADGVMYYVAGVPNGNVYARTDTLAWRAMRPTGGPSCSEPGASVLGTTFFVGCRGADGLLHVAYGTVTPGQVPTLGEFQAVGTQQIAGGPAMAVIDGVVNYFVTAPGSGANVFVTTRNGNFTPLPYGCVGRPAIGLAANLNITWLACTAPNRALYIARNSGTGWPGATRLGGVVLFSPGIAVAADGTGTAYVEGSDNGVYSHPLAGPAGGFSLIGGKASAGGVAARRRQG